MQRFHIEKKKIIHHADSLIRQWLDYRCLACQTKSKADLCEDCRQQLTPIGVHCPTCARSVADARYACGKCLQQGSALDAVMIAYRYREPLREVVLQAKYAHHRGALSVLAELIIDALPATFAADAIVPMPMSARRLAQRGFNQTHYLARRIAKHYACRVCNDCLVKAPRQAQSLLDTDKQRQRNIKGAFRARYPLGGRLLLVDDIMTSGATGQEAAKTLKTNGAAWVGLAVVAAR